VLGVFVAAQIRFGSNVTPPYLALSLALSLALPVLWVAALWLAGAYDVRFIGFGRKRASGKCMHSVVAVGHELTVADLVTELGRDRYHGLTVFAQRRVGQDGREFRIHKLRTMVADAEQRRAGLLASNDYGRVLSSCAQGSAGQRGRTAPGSSRWGREVRGACPLPPGGQAGPLMAASAAGCADDTSRHR
jgi:hypothetical protein